MADTSKHKTVSRKVVVAGPVAGIHVPAGEAVDLTPRQAKYIGNRLAADTPVKQDKPKGK